MNCSDHMASGNMMTAMSKQGGHGDHGKAPAADRDANHASHASHANDQMLKVDPHQTMMPGDCCLHSDCLSGASVATMKRIRTPDMMAVVYSMTTPRQLTDQPSVTIALFTNYKLRQAPLLQGLSAYKKHLAITSRQLS